VVNAYDDAAKKKDRRSCELLGRKLPADLPAAWRLGPTSIPGRHRRGRRRIRPKAAAIGEFMKFIHENSVAWATTGHMSPFKSVLDSVEYEALPQRAGYASTGQVEADAIPPVKNYPSVETALKEAINPVPQGADPAAALKQAQEQVQGILGGG
jgi:hypothetical protein